MSQVWPSVINRNATSYMVLPQPPTVDSESPPAPRWCHCIIDLSTPATLERDFYAWLNGDKAILHQTAPCCVFASSSTAQCQPNYSSYYIPKSDSDDANTCSISSSLIYSNNNENVNMKCKPRNRSKLTTALDKVPGTNLYGRPYCPGRPLCMDERLRIIQFYKAGMKVNAISKQLCISHGCVSKIITRYRETGLLVPSSHSHYRRKAEKDTV